MAEEGSPQDNNLSSHESPDASTFLDGWMAAADPILIEAARFAALPHRIDLNLLTSLIEEREDAPALRENLPLLVEQLRRTQILIPIDEAGELPRFTMQSASRERLIQNWQTEHLAAYQQLSLLAARFYFNRLPENRSDDLEYIYHLLAANEEQGAELMAVAFEQALAQHQIGRAERLQRYAQEQAPILNVTAQAWIRYFEARVELAKQHHERSEAILLRLAEETIDPYLRAQALMSLAAIQASTQRWPEAFGSFAAAEALYLQVGDQFQLARLHAAQGAAYVHLATALGGLAEAFPMTESSLRRWATRIQHGPFLLYRWLSRRFNILPNLYFGTNYQDWFIIRLYYEAIRRYEQALSLLTGSGSQDAGAGEVFLADIEIRLADLQHIIGRWKLAEQKFARLADSAVAKANDYRDATLHLAMGRAALARGRSSEARSDLEGAYRTFEEYEDLSSLTVTGRLLGYTELKSGHVDVAVTVYLESGEAARNNRDFLAATEIGWVLARLQEQNKLPQTHDQKITQFRESLRQRAYIARFPGELLEHFRRRAAYIVAPLIFALIWLLGAQALFLAGGLETFYRAALNDSIRLLELGAVVLFFAALILLTVWGYELIYVLIGRRYARNLPIEDLSRHQPKYVLLQQDALYVRDERSEQRKFSWDDIKEIISADWSFWRAPVALFSQFILISTSSSELVLEGIFRQYGNLKLDIGKHLERTSKSPVVEKFDFSFFRSWWTLLALLLTLIMAYITFTDLLDPEQPQPIIITATVLSNNFVYVINDQGEFLVTDFSNPWRPKLVQERPAISWQANAITLSGPYAYAAAGEDGLHVLSIEDLSRPTEVGHVDTPGCAEDVAIVGNFAYVADGRQGVTVADISNPQEPVLDGYIDTPGYAGAVAVQGSYLYVADGADGLQIFELAERDKDQQTGAAPTAGACVRAENDEADRGAIELVVRDDYAYVVSEGDGLLVVNIADPGVPLQEGKFANPSLTHVALLGRYAFLVDKSGVVWIANIAKPKSIEKVNRIDLKGSASGLAISAGAGLVYVGDSQSGLLAYMIPDPRAEELDDFLVGTIDNITVGEITVLPSYALPTMSLFYHFLIWARFLFPIFGLVRLFFHRRRLYKARNKPLGVREQLPILIALLILTLLTLRQAYLLIR